MRNGSALNAHRVVQPLHERRFLEAAPPIVSRTLKRYNLERPIHTRSEQSELSQTNGRKRRGLQGKIARNSQSAYCRFTHLDDKIVAVSAAPVPSKVHFALLLERENALVTEALRQSQTISEMRMTQQGACTLVPHLGPLAHRLQNLIRETHFVREKIPFACHGRLL